MKTDLAVMRLAGSLLVGMSAISQSRLYWRRVAERPDEVTAAMIASRANREGIIAVHRSRCHGCEQKKIKDERALQYGLQYSGL